MSMLKGSTVLVTGAASGIGYECALAFANKGANLVISDINSAALESLRREVEDRGVRCLALCCDVTDGTAVRELAATVNEELGPPHILVNNAGIAFLGAFEETPDDMWRKTLDVNVMGIVHFTRAFLPAMRREGGARKVVNVASLAGVAPAPNMSAYAASKHAVVGLSEVLSLELAGSEISVLVVCPGIIHTNITEANSMVAPGFGEDNLARLQQYYRDKGAHPRVVAEDMLRAIEKGNIYEFTGPMARTSSFIARVSRRLARKLTLLAARESCYMQQ
jgi:NAD(P)-dependent dehydrogenase (short-subunit alcohol dehydrogenase family)